MQPPYRAGFNHSNGESKVFSPILFGNCLAPGQLSASGAQDMTALAVGAIANPSHAVDY
jgi:hypothetical protein